MEIVEASKFLEVEIMNFSNCGHYVIIINLKKTLINIEIINKL